MLRQGTLARLIIGDRRRAILCLLAREVYDGGKGEGEWQTREELRPLATELLKKYKGSHGAPRRDTMAWLKRHRLVRSRIRRTDEKTFEVTRADGTTFKRRPTSVGKVPEIRRVEYSLSKSGEGYARLFQGGRSAAPKMVGVPQKKGIVLRSGINDFRFEGSLVEDPTVVVKRGNVQTVEIVLAQVPATSRRKQPTPIRRRFWTNDLETAEMIEGIPLYSRILVCAKAGSGVRFEILAIEVLKRRDKIDDTDPGNAKQVAWVITR